MQYMDLDLFDNQLEALLRTLKGMPPKQIRSEPFIGLYGSELNARAAQLTAVQEAISLLQYVYDSQQALLTRAQLVKLGVKPTDSDKYLEPLNKYMRMHDITTPIRIAHFMAQILHESGYFKWTTELWGPTPQQTAYEGREDLGNTEPGDGYKYRGRGLIQLTGRANYANFAKFAGVDVLNEPKLVGKPDLAVLSSCWFWHRKSLNQFADNDDLITITRRINGGTNGLALRRKILEDVKLLFNSP